MFCCRLRSRRRYHYDVLCVCCVYVCVWLVERATSLLTHSITHNALCCVPKCIFRSAIVTHPPNPTDRACLSICITLYFSFFFILFFIFSVFIHQLSWYLELNKIDGDDDARQQKYENILVVIITICYGEQFFRFFPHMTNTECTMITNNGSNTHAHALIFTYAEPENCKGVVSREFEMLKNNSTRENGCQRYLKVSIFLVRSPLIGYSLDVRNRHCVTNFSNEISNPKCFRPDIFKQISMPFRRIGEFHIHSPAQL